jgi:hypothetical protein
MNIFVLSRNIKKCAMYHCDKHIVKMILESAQMLCTAIWLSGGTAPYRKVHMKHPCTLWALESLSNWRWLRELTKELNEEFKYRYDKKIDHKSYEVVKTLQEPEIEDKGLTEFAQAMFDQFKVPGDPIKAYRQFYVGSKHAFASWAKRPVPEWYPPMRAEYEARNGIGHVVEKNKPKSKRPKVNKVKEDEEYDGKKLVATKTNRKKVVQKIQSDESADIQKPKIVIKKTKRPSTASSVRSNGKSTDAESIASEIPDLSSLSVGRRILTRKSRKAIESLESSDNSSLKRKSSDDEKPPKRRKL